MRAAMTGLLAIVAVESAHAGGGITVVERVAQEQTVARMAGVDSAGDLLVFQNPIYDAENKREIGKDLGYCIRIVPGQSYACTWTLSLSDGQITSEGPYYDQSDSTMIITGGTGKYAGAKGTLSLHARDTSHTAYDFRYELL